MGDCETNLRERILELSKRFKQDSQMFASMGLTSLISGELKGSDLQAAMSLYGSIGQIKVLIEVYNQSVDDPEMRDVEKQVVSEFEQIHDVLYDYLGSLKEAINDFKRE